MRQTSSSPLVERLSWDSNFWGVSSARLNATTTSELDRGLVECRELGVRWTSMLVPVERTALIDAAIRSGFQMVDVRITLTKAIEASGEPSEVCLIAPEESPQAQALVEGAFRISRFCVDAHLDSARCDEFYRTWVRNSFSGEMADAIVASRHEGSLDAFVTIRRDSDRMASLPLVAVRSDRRGIGVGRRVVLEALNWLSARGQTTVGVTTQLANVGAIRLYESLGFAINESGVWLHHWFEPD
jgi:dTDP-4-amino-4,6-dideoxy-D-galactose acyltransferase